jgi:hypothetical protein
MDWRMKTWQSRRKIRWFQNVGCDARREHFKVPGPVIVVLHGTRIFPTQHLGNALLHFLIRLPVPGRRHGAALIAVLVILFRIPHATAHALNQIGGHAISLDRQRGIGVDHIRFGDTFHTGIDIAWQSWRLRETFNYRFAHLLPQQPYAIHVGR